MSFVPAPQVAPAKNAPPSSVAPGTAAASAAAAPPRARPRRSQMVRCVACWLFCLFASSGSGVGLCRNRGPGNINDADSLQQSMGSLYASLLGFEFPAYCISSTSCMSISLKSHLSLSLTMTQLPTCCNPPQLSSSSSSVPSISSGSTRAP